MVSLDLIPPLKKCMAEWETCGEGREPPISPLSLLVLQEWVLLSWLYTELSVIWRSNEFHSFTFVLSFLVHFRERAGKQTLGSVWNLPVPKRLNSFPLTLLLLIWNSWANCSFLAELVWLYLCWGCRILWLLVKLCSSKLKWTIQLKWTVGFMLHLQKCSELWGSPFAVACSPPVLLVSAALILVCTVKLGQWETLK